MGFGESRVAKPYERTFTLRRSAASSPLAGDRTTVTRRVAMLAAVSAVPFMTACASIASAWLRGTSSVARPLDVVILGVPDDANLQASLSGWLGAGLRTVDGPDPWLCPRSPWRTETDAATGLKIDGRTPLGFAYGVVNPPPPSIPAGSRPTMPDVIVTSTTWLYWLAPLLSDLSGPLAEMDNRTQFADVPQAVLRQGTVFCPGRGSFMGAMPILRNPMGLAMVARPAHGQASALKAPEAPARWTWADLLAMVQSAGLPILSAGLPINGGSFTGHPGWPTPPTLAGAAMVSYGGGFGARPTLTNASALEAWADLFPLLTAGGPESTAPGPAAPGPAGAGPTGAIIAPNYLFPPFTTSGDLAADYTLKGPWPVSSPLPSGPARRAVPVAHLVACVPVGAQQPHRAAAYIAGLLSKNGQQRLRHWNGGLVLRPDDARAQLAADQPRLLRPEDWVDADADLLPADLWGGPLTETSAPLAYAAADAFAAALAKVATAAAASAIRREMDQAQTALPHSLPPLAIGTCG